MAADTVATGLAWTFQFAVGSPAGRAPSVLAGTVLVLVAVTGLVGCVAVQEGYRSWLHVGGPENLARVLRATAVSVGVVVLTAALLAVDLSVPGAVLGGCWTLVAVGAARWTLSILIARRRRRGELVDRSLLVGSDETAYRFWRHVVSRPDAGRVVVGYVGVARECTTDWRLPRLGAALDAPAVAVAHGLDGIVITPDAIGADDLGSVVRRAHARGLDVELVGGPALVHPRRLSVGEVAHHAVVFVEPRRVSTVRDAAKRVFDLVVGAALLVVVSPRMLAAAIAVVLDDGRPVYYRQVRVGRDRATFRLWKFRTMHRGADRHEAKLRHRNERGRGPLFKIADDPRTTRVGRLLRATSVDELPQLFNVLGGSMSLVGPRPALVDQEAEFDPELQTRSRVKPGMTGLWQIEARDNPDFHAYRQLDLFYAENWSFALDVAVLAWTLPGLIRHGLTVRRQRAAAAGGSFAADPSAARDERVSGGSSATDDDVLAAMLPVEHTTFAGFGPR
jgi:exopolysaccharide biosynthesis polyprenyl glycosylphosphotransferase